MRTHHSKTKLDFNDLAELWLASLQLFLFHVPESYHPSYECLHCTKTFHAINDVSDNDEEAQEEEAALEPIPAGCTPGWLEADPGDDTTHGGPDCPCPLTTGVVRTSWQLLLSAG